MDQAVVYMAIAMSMMVAAMIWNVWSLVLSVWSDPGHLPFLSQRVKTFQGAAGQWNITAREKTWGISGSAISRFPPCYNFSEKGQYDQLIDQGQNQNAGSKVEESMDNLTLNIPRNISQ